MGLFGFGKSRAKEYKTADVYRDLRQKVLTLDPSQIGVKPSPSSRIWGLLMETGYSDAVATLVMLADGTVSLYLSNGGGIIGAGQHEGPRKACESLLAAAPQFFGYARQSTDFPLPQEGRVRFHFLTFDGVFASEASEQDLGNNRHPLSALFYKAHDVITQLRRVDEKIKNAGGQNREAEIPDAYRELMHASTNGDADRTKKLLDAGINPNAADPTGLTPLMGAAHEGKDNTLRLLLAAGASVDVKDSSGYTALMFASNAGRLSCAQMLLEHGADVNACDLQESTPIMFAAQHGHNALVRLLLSKGADPTRKGKHGLSAIGFAQQNGLHETEQLLSPP
jgi:hypothetical protein